MVLFDDVSVEEEEEEVQVFGTVWIVLFDDTLVVEEEVESSGTVEIISIDESSISESEETFGSIENSVVWWLRWQEW